MAMSPVGPRPGAVRRARAGSRDGRRGSDRTWIRHREARRRPGQSGQPVRGHAAQHRLDGARPDGRPGRQVRPRAPARRLREHPGPLQGPGAHARQAADVHERLRHRRAQAARPRARAPGRPPDRDRRLRAPVRQAAVPRGRHARRAQRPALGHRRAGDRKGSEATDRDRRPGAGREGPRPVDVRGRREGAAADPPRCLRRRGRGVGPRRDVEGRQPVEQLRAPGAGRRRRRDGATAAPKPGEVGGPADAQGIRRTKTGWRRILPGGTDDDAEGSSGKGGKR